MQPLTHIHCHVHHQTTSSSAVSKSFLSSPRDGDSTTSLSSLFQCLEIFSINFFSRNIQSKPLLAELEQSRFRKCGNSQAQKCEWPWQDSGVLKHSAVKAAEVSRGRAAHGDHISVLEEKERIFSN